METYVILYPRVNIGSARARRTPGDANLLDQSRARSIGPPSPRSAHLGHRSLQLPLPLLHAGGDLRRSLRVPVAAATAHVRGNLAPGADLRRARRREAPDHGRRAAVAARAAEPDRGPGED